MRRRLLLLAAGTALLCLANPAWGQDSGVPDTFYLEIYPDDQVQSGGPPYFVRFPVYITHDVLDPVDSLASVYAILCYEHSNPSKYCSLTSYWNNTYVYPSSGLDRSIFRHYIETGDTVMHNWMMDFSQQEMGLEWDFRFLDLDGTSEYWFSMVPTGASDQLFGGGSRVLTTTMNFKLEDTVTICIDTCFWPPGIGPLTFANAAAQTWVPRHFMPVCEHISRVPFTIYVDDDNTAGPWNGSQEHPYLYIQDGVNAANSGDTVYVFSGFYFENVVVDRSINLVGQNKENTIVDADADGSCVRIDADGVTVSGFTVRNSGGIFLDVGGVQISSSYCMVANNIAKENAFHGIIMFGEYGDRHGNTISNNVVTDNGWAGIRVSGFGGAAYDNVISDNLITGTTYLGIDLDGDINTIVSANTIENNQWGIAATEPGTNGVTISENSIRNNERGITNDSWSGFYDSRISNNTIMGNTLRGIYVVGSRDTICDNLIANNGGTGISLNMGDENAVFDNVVTNNADGGLSLDMIHDSEVSGNYIAQNRYGVNLNHTTYNNLILENTIANNAEYGVYVAYAWDNTIYHNDLINNGINAFNEDISNVNFWDDGYPSGGNCWSDYSGVDTMSGPGQDTPGSDGMGDTPYEIPGGGQDNYPLLSGCQYVRGDANGDDLINITDVLYMLNYLFRSGPSPVSFMAGDANCDDDLGILDPLYLLNYLYKGGPPPGC